DVRGDGALRVPDAAAGLHDRRRHALLAARRGGGGLGGGGSAHRGLGEEAARALPQLRRGHLGARRGPRAAGPRRGGLARALDDATLLAQKRDAAARAAALVESGMAVGLGSGSTALLAVEALARRVAEGALRDVVGIPTSRSTADFAQARGLTLTDLE